MGELDTEVCFGFGCKVKGVRFWIRGLGSGVWGFRLSGFGCGVHRLKETGPRFGGGSQEGQIRGDQRRCVGVRGVDPHYAAYRHLVVGVRVDG